ncbi:MAG: cell division protein FtsQ/DivIB [Acidimicrobiales bacterium]
MDSKIRERRASVLRSMRRRRSLLLMVPIGAMLLAGLGFAVFRSSLFSIHQIDVTGATVALNTAAEDSLSNLKGASALTTSDQAIRSRLSSLGLVRVVSLEVSSFGTIRIRLALRHPVAVVEGPQGSWLSVDSSGIVVATSTVEPHLPLICQLSQGSLSLLAVPPTLSCGAFDTSGQVGSPYLTSVVAALRALPQLSPSTQARFPMIAVTGGQSDLVLLDNHGDGCLLGSPSAAATKSLLCQQLIPSADPGQRFLADVSVPTVPAVSALP